MLGAVRFLENSLSRRPLTTNCILYGSLSGLAEFSQQTVIKVIILKKTKNTFLVFKLLNIAFVDFLIWIFWGETLKVWIKVHVNFFCIS